MLTPRGVSKRAMSVGPTDAGGAVFPQPGLRPRRMILRVGMALLGLALAVALTTVAIFNRMSDRQSEGLATLDKLKTVDRAIVNARTLEQQFNLLRRPESADAFQKQAREILLDVADLKSRTPEGLRHAKIVDLENLAVTYRQDVSEAQAGWRTIGLHENDALMKSIRANRMGLEKLLEDHAAAEIAILVVAKHEKDFIARLTPEKIEMTRDAVVQTRAAIQRDIRDPSRRNRYLDMLAVYEVDFAKFSQARLTVAALDDKIAPVFTEMQTLLRDLIQQAQADFDEGVRRQAGVTRLSMWLVGVGSVVMLLLLGLVTAVLGRDDPAAAGKPKSSL
jgi:methyl-accepting chemotaxis protein